MTCEADFVAFDYVLGAKDRIVTGNGELLPAIISETGKERGYIPHTCGRRK